MSSPFARPSDRSSETALDVVPPTPLPGHRADLVPATSVPSLRPGPRLGLPTGDELDALLAYGDVIVRSGIAPNHIKTPEAALVVMRYGHQLGIDEFTALQNMFVVGGKPAAMASLLHALILRDHGGDAVQVLESSPAACRLRCRRRDSAHTSEIAYTIEEAKAAGLTSDTWKKYPADLLFARAISRAGRQLFRDSTMGMYTPEEIGGSFVEVAGEVIDTRPPDAEPPAPSANPLAKVHAIGAEHGLDHDALHRIAVFHGYRSLAELTPSMRADFEVMVAEADPAERALWATDWADLIALVEEQGSAADLLALGERMKAAGISSARHTDLAVAYKAALDRLSASHDAHVTEILRRRLVSIHLMHRVTLLALPPMETLVLLLLADNANDDGLAWPSVDLVAWKANLPPRSVKRVLHALRGRGVIQPEGTMQGGRGHTTRYRLYLDRAPAKPPFVARKGDAPSPFDAYNGDPPSPFPQKGVPPSPFPTLKGDTAVLKGDGDGLKGDPPSPKPSRTVINQENVNVNVNYLPGDARALAHEGDDGGRLAAAAALRRELTARQAKEAILPAQRLTAEQRALLRSLPFYRQQLGQLEALERKEAR